MDICAVFAERFPRLDCEKNFSLAKHTTIGCGGIAELAVSPVDAEECAEVLAFAARKGIARYLLGAGANTLPCDGFYHGVVVRFHKMRDLSREGALVYAGAGVSGGKLLSFAKRCLVGGFEPLAGIPTTVGGGTAMNAGISDGHFSDFVQKVTVAEAGKVYTLSAKDCRFSEKDSIFLQEKIAVTGVWLQGYDSFSERIEQSLCYYRTRRRRLPVGKSMGCTFVNPEGQSAGALIESCGLKGFRIGGAVVSQIHANFIINESGSAGDVAKLIDFVKERVKERTGILLREEVRRMADGC